ncbi:MAG: hypothetical protein K2G66_00170, partial [Alistipes sp.]|nr:hypothetical protein [Alistipes sp.]MDE5906043.1 hypothetical protein [Alistipes sp.]
MKKSFFWLCGGLLSVWSSGCSSDGTDPAASVVALDIPVPVLAMNGDRATIAWRAVDHACLYAWELSADTDRTPVTGVSVAPSHSFPMEEESVYSFRVMAKAEAGSGYSDSPWSSYVVFTTRNHEQLAAPVASVKSRTAV